MLLPTHILAAYTIADLIKNFGLNKRKILILTSIIFAVIPDFDLLITRQIAVHHQTLIHCPLFWILISITVFIFGRISSNKSIFKILSLGIAIGSLSHFFFDTFGMSVGIAWLAPFSWKEYSFFHLRQIHNEQKRLYYYVRSKAFLVETMLLIILLAVFVKRKIIRRLVVAKR